ncbi:MAG: hypothetical protein JEY91_14445 [Spirochaetaceae bacterium]|nr:hypothetical protein [Spirochaetaceae bacterium]
MSKKIDFPDKLEIRQDLWVDTPCSQCPETYCCGNLPLTPLRLNRHSDFINLILSSCYNGVFPVLKKTGEWTFYLERDCRYLGKGEGLCTIHQESHQSVICKSYNAHTCWYVEAFSTERYTTMIRFNTEMIIWYEKRYKLIEKNFNSEIDWNELCNRAYDYRQNMIDINPESFKPFTSNTLSFKKSRVNQLLFFPPYNRPANRKHFELLSFRLGFPGIYLAISDSCWAFMVSTELNLSRFNNIRQEYYRTIKHKDGAYSFDQIFLEQRPFSETGEQWIILQRSDLKTLIDLTVFDSSDRVRKIPSSSIILKALKSKSPNRAAS